MFFPLPPRGQHLCPHARLWTSLLGKFCRLPQVSLPALFLPHMTFACCLLRPSCAVAGASLFLENSALFPSPCDWREKPRSQGFLCHTFVVPFEQIFQRVGHFQGHASRRTVGGVAAHAYSMPFRRVWVCLSSLVLQSLSPFGPVFVILFGGTWCMHY